MRKLFLALLAGFALTSVQAEDPFKPGTQWKGNYYCNQGWTDLTVTILSNEAGHTKGVFRFHHQATQAHGSFYLMGSSYDESNEKMSFEPGDWIEHPISYETVGMNGMVLDNGLIYKGEIDHPGCGEFKLTLIQQSDTDRAASLAATLKEIDGLHESEKLVKRGLLAVSAQTKINFFTKAIQLKPQDPQPYKARAYARAYLRDYRGAVEDFNKHLELDPHCVEAKTQLGLIEIEQKKYEQALKTLSQATYLNPQYQDAWMGKSLAEELLGLPITSQPKISAGKKAHLPAHLSKVLYLPILFGLIFMGFGIRLITRKPLVFSMSVFYWIPGAALIVLAITQNSYGTSHIPVFLIPIVFFGIWLFDLRKNRRYVIFNVTAEMVYESLYEALKKLGLVYEEKMSKLTLKTDEGEISVSMQDVNAWSWLRFKMDKNLEAQIISEFKNSIHQKKNPQFPFIGYVYLGIGLVLVVMILNFGFFL